MTAKDLKASILQLAIQGKLVPQDPNDEPASALLARIRDSRVEVEKCRKTGTRGRAKTPASPQPITDGDLSSVALAKEEKPFDLPEGWAWCRLEEVCEFIADCPHTTAVDEGIGYPLVRTANIGFARLVYQGMHRVSKAVYDERNFRAIPRAGDLIFAREAPAGNVAVIQEDEQVCLGQRTVLISPLREVVYSDYLAYLILAPATQERLIGKATGTTVAHVNLADIRPFLIPLPPLAEQKRIVAKIEELMPMVERYGTVKEQSDALEAALPDAFRKSVLQYAIQGKLVPQDPNDEPASALLERIAAARNAVTPRKGRARTPAAPQPIPEDEQPFDLPEGWAWCRLGELGVTNIGLTYRPQDVSSNGTPVLRSNNIQNGIIVLDELVRVNIGVPDRAIAHTNDILICARNGSKALVGKSAIVTSEGMAFGAFMTILRTPYYRYVHMFLCSELFRAQLTDSNTTTINQITQDKLKNIVIPLPPLAEQKRIVAEVGRLLLLGKNVADVVINSFA